jgi:ribosomal protein L37AE/L43A
MLPDPYLSDLMKTHRFSIVNMESLGGGRASWESGGTVRAGGLTFDSAGRWREVALKMRRELICEACGREFAYTFRVIAGGTVSRGQRTLDPTALVATLEQQLRRRIHCPHCHALQRDVRRAFRRREVHHSLVGITAVGGTIVGAMGLSSGGYILAGELGLMAGLGLSVALVLVLTRWMLARLLDQSVSLN